MPEAQPFNKYKNKFMWISMKTLFSRKDERVE